MVLLKDALDLGHVVVLGEKPVRQQVLEFLQLCAAAAQLLLPAHCGSCCGCSSGRSTRQPRPPRRALAFAEESRVLALEWRGTSCSGCEHALARASNLRWSSWILVLSDTAWIPAYSCRSPSVAVQKGVTAAGVRGTLLDRASGVGPFDGPAVSARHSSNHRGFASNHCTRRCTRPRVHQASWVTRVKTVKTNRKLIPLRHPLVAQVHTLTLHSPHVLASHSSRG